MTSSRLLLLLIFTMTLELGSSDFARDRSECESQLLGPLGTCLTFVLGGHEAPTPDCCTGMKVVVAKSFKCLCLLVKDRDAPELGVRVNETLAMSLPSKCQTPANVSDCPRLLGLPPNSKDARVFEQFGSEIQESTVKSGGGNSTGIKDGATHASVATTGRSKRWLGMEMGCGVWMSYLPLVLHLLLGG